MKKIMLTLAAAAVLAVSATAASAQTIQRVPDPTPTSAFTDEQDNAGYVEIRSDGVRACNENPGTPAGDGLTGYAWIDAGNDGNAGHNDDDPDADGISYGNGRVGAGDYDGDGEASGNEDANGNGELDEGEDADGDNTLDSNTSDCPGENAP